MAIGTGVLGPGGTGVIGHMKDTCGWLSSQPSSGKRLMELLYTGNEF